MIFRNKYWILKYILLVHVNEVINETLCISTVKLDIITFYILESESA